MPDFRNSGRHFLIGLQRQPVLTDHDKQLLSRLRPSGIVVFRDNFRHDVAYADWLSSFRKLLDDVYDCIDSDKLLVCIDHEGGGVVRPPAPITRYAHAAEWSEQAKDVGRAVGIELKSLGVNINFAPVVDVASNPDNPVIGPRAFSHLPDVVAASAGAFLRAMQAEGVIGCLKHFPGHGDADLDSHYGLPSVDADAETLHARELAPFRELIGDDVHLIMTAHIVFPGIDPGVPATMSARFLKEILRDKLGYTRTIVSDDLGMGAVTRMFGKGDAVQRTINAGTDLLTVCAYWTDTMRALDFARQIEDGRRSGEIARDTLERSEERINDLLQRVTRHDVRSLPGTAFAHHRNLAPLGTTARSPRNGASIS